jgi:hypothetical protein
MLLGTAGFTLVLMFLVLATQFDSARNGDIALGTTYEVQLSLQATKSRRGLAEPHLAKPAGTV